jgi:hypothetical protein
MTPDPTSSGDAVEIHATAVAIDGRGVLLRGRSGAGKSDLALRLVDRGALLVSDDRVRIERRGGMLYLLPPPAAPAALRHRLEVRGLGIVPLPGIAEAPLALVVDLAPGRSLERLPEPQSCGYLGKAVPLLTLDPFAASAPAKLRLAAGLLTGSIIPPP